MPGPENAPVLLYDGACGVCGSSVQLILRRDRRGALRFAALQGAFAATVRSRHPDLNGVDSMIWVEPGSPGVPERVFVRSAAALRAAGYLGGVWRLALMAALLPRRLRDGAYDLVARHRHRLTAAGGVCQAPACVPPGRLLD
jgi:predicted DCC family thiol-disulfide oxidoreductase YuxK